MDEGKFNGYVVDYSEFNYEFVSIIFWIYLTTKSERILRYNKYLLQLSLGLIIVIVNTFCFSGFAVFNELFNYFVLFMSLNMLR